MKKHLLYLSAAAIVSASGLPVLAQENSVFAWNRKAQAEAGVIIYAGSIATDRTYVICYDIGVDERIDVNVKKPNQATGFDAFFSFAVDRGSCSSIVPNQNRIEVVATSETSTNPAGGRFFIVD